MIHIGRAMITAATAHAIDRGPHAMHRTVMTPH